MLDEAASLGAQLIVTHHPILFRGRKNLCSDDPEGRLLCKLVKSDVALVAAHTNFDNAHPGVNDALAARLGLENVQPGAHGMCVGEISPMALECFADMVRGNLGGAVRRYGDGARVIRRAAVLGGAGEDFARDALAAGADVYVTGEMGYHRALSAAGTASASRACARAAGRLTGAAGCAAASPICISSVSRSYPVSVTSLRR